MKDLDLMHEPQTNSDEESLGDESIPEEQQLRMKIKKSTNKPQKSKWLKLKQRVKQMKMLLY